MTLHSNKDYSCIKMAKVNYLDNNWILRQFDDIESKVENLIEVCKSLAENNAELKERIKGLEQEIQNHAENERLYDEQKAVVRIKIESLLSKLDNFSQSEAKKSM